jgi:response regulator RpfG family c-di-GMP phosphodiesterase
MERTLLSGKIMSEKILFVDDDRNLLSACERNFRRRFQLDTAESGQAGLARLAESGPYAVIVADRQMPQMDGIQFLAAAKQQAPDSVRIMLTGNADLEAAIRVVNEGNIFRFLTKPCPPDLLGKVIDDGCAMYRLVTAEKELLNKTLSGSIKLLTDILSTVDAQSFGRTEKLRSLINDAAQRMSLENAWEVHLAAMLAPIGYVTLPPETLLKARTGQALSKIEDQLLRNVPEIAARLLAHIPRLQNVAQIVRYQDKHYDGTGLPLDGAKGESIPEGARLLKIAFDMLQLQTEGLAAAKALNELQHRQGWYDPKLLEIVRAGFATATNEPDTAKPNISVAVHDLAVGMVLYSDLLTKDGTLVLSAGHQITEMSLERIQNFEQLSGIKEPIFVEIAA